MILTLLSGLSLCIWIGLLIGRGSFWLADQRLELDTLASKPDPDPWPSVCAVIPARNEADVLPQTLGSLLCQDYPGSFHIILVDDRSTDDSAMVAQAIAAGFERTERLTVMRGDPLPSGWSGKVWAMAQGVTAGIQQDPDYWLLTDADIQHTDSSLTQLVLKAEQDHLDLVSWMVLLRCESIWERWLIPAFVFFFQKLYPFRQVNQPDHPMAAAAGGCILLHQSALNRIGGLARIRSALIDDCSLAAAIKGSQSSSGRRGLWLGLTETTRSLRPYPQLADIWGMVARTAYTQLNYSPLLLMGTVLGMTVIYLIPPLGLIWGLVFNHAIGILFAGTAWILMMMAYRPTLTVYRRSILEALLLPGVALLYMLMTINSALKHWQGSGGVWKGRSYP